MTSQKPYPPSKSALLAELRSTQSVRLSRAASDRLERAPWQWAASLLRRAATLPPHYRLHVTAPNRLVPGGTNRVALEAIPKRDA